MAEIKVEIKNLPQIKAVFKKSPLLMMKNLNVAIRRSAIGISGQASANAPIDQGGLRASIIRDVFYGNLKARIEPQINYAGYVHEGTGIYVGHRPYYANIPGVGWRYMLGMRPRPYLKQAVEQKDREVQKNFEKAVEKTLDEIGRAT